MKYALISGGTGGIGTELCRSFARRGYQVIATAPPGYEGELEVLKKECGVIPVVLDVANLDDIKKLKKIVEAETGGRLDILYNNAGIAVGGPAVVFDDDAVAKLYQVNLLGHIYMTKYMLEFVINAQGAIIYTALVAARVPLTWCAHYNATKAAIDHYAKTLRGEMAPFGVRVYLIITGGVDTPISGRNPAAKQKMVDMVMALPFAVPELEETMRATSLMTNKTWPPKRYAELVVAEIESRTLSFNIYRGQAAYLLHFIGRYIPLCIQNYLLAKKFRALEVYRALREKTKRLQQQQRQK